MFILTSSLFGMPISGTHTVIGALLGAGLVVTGADGLNWSQMIKIVASWFISPVTAGLLSFLTMMVVLALTQNTKTISF
jgi:PiT family inorganic phosphate transporter